MKKVLVVLGLFVVASIALAACAPAAPAPEAPAAEAPAAEAPAAEEPAAEEPVVEEVERAPISACLVTDSAGIGDRSFNDMVWKGLQQANTDFGVEINYIESKSADDYGPNLQACVDSDAEMIVCVGFMMADACAASYEANPDRYYVGVDMAWLAGDNLSAVDAYMDQSCFMAGYLAAGMTQTGKVATYTGFFGPVVQIFMDGFYMGVQEYNKVHGTEVEVLGYDPAQMDLSAATGSWVDVDAGRQLTETFMDNGADIVLPVAGNVGTGSAAVMEERGFGYIFGVDQDWTLTNPQYNAQILASATKNMDVCVYKVADGLTLGEFTPGICLLNLENGGTELLFNESIDIPADLKAEVEALAPKIISGEIQTLSDEFLAANPR